MAEQGTKVDMVTHWSTGAPQIAALGVELELPGKPGLLAPATEPK